MKTLAWPIPRQYGSVHLGLERIQNFLAYLGNPQERLQNVIHIGGTNGKGSISAFLKYILQAHGYTVNRYTSPHLVHFNERIEVLNHIISDEQLLHYLEQCRQLVLNSGIELSYFESLTATAIMAFAEHPADYNIIEVGLGGRLDATNVFSHPLATVISTISLDHMHILGDSVEAIAQEKAGILKPTIPLILNAQQPKILQLYQTLAAQQQLPLYAYGKDFRIDLDPKGIPIFNDPTHQFNLPKIGLPGMHQLNNCATALATLLTTAPHNFTIAKLQQGVTETQWPARLTHITTGKLASMAVTAPAPWQIWLDGAHNEDGGRALSEWLNTQPQPVYLMLGMLHDKDIRAFLRNFCTATLQGIIPIDFHFTEQRSSFKRAELIQILQELKLPVWSCPELDNLTQEIDCATALQYLLQYATGGTLVIAGSLYLMGQILDYNTTEA